MRFSSFLLPLSLLVLRFGTTSSHECDDHDAIPTIEDIKSKFQLSRVADGSYCTQTFKSTIQVISNLTFANASSNNLFMLTTEENPNTYCWDECPETPPGPSIVDDDDDFFDDDVVWYDDWHLTWDACWTNCTARNPVNYGLSYFHKLRHDETWHFLLGDTIYIYELDNAASNDMKITKLGKDSSKDEVLSYTVPANTWFAAQVNPKSKSDEVYALGATVVSPGFETGDYVLADVPLADNFLNYTYHNAKSKILELSFYPSADLEVDTSFAVEGGSSLCVPETRELEDCVTEFGLVEGPKSGYYLESFTDPDMVTTTYGGDRASMSTVYYAMNDTVFFHKSFGDETYYFYFGEPIILYEIDTTSTPSLLRAVPLGSDILIGQVPYYTVKAENWVAFEFRNNNYTYWNMTNTTPYCFLGLENAPGYHLSDLEFGVPEALTENFPEFESTIKSLYEQGTAQDELLDGNSTGNGTDYSTSSLQSMQQPKSSKERGLVALYVFMGLALVGLMAAFFMARNKRRGKEMDTGGGKEGVTVYVERGGNLETVSVCEFSKPPGPPPSSKRREKSSHVDWTGAVHSKW